MLVWLMTPPCLLREVPLHQDTVLLLLLLRRFAFEKPKGAFCARGQLEASVLPAVRCGPCGPRSFLPSSFGMELEELLFCTQRVPKESAAVPGGGSSAALLLHGTFAGAGVCGGFSDCLPCNLSRFWHSPLRA